MTLHAWAALPEDEPGELVDGRLVEEEMPSYVHEAIVAWLLVHVGAWALARGGSVAGSEAKFAVGPTRGRKPDLSVHLPGAPLPPGRAPLLTKPPGIAVEVISPRPRDAKRDRVDKLDEYAAFGVHWYWIVDPELRTLEIYELGSDRRYVRALGAADGKIAVPGCDGLEIDLDALWSHVDRLEAVQDDE